MEKKDEMTKTKNTGRGISTRKREIRDALMGKKTETQIMLGEIKIMMGGGTLEYHTWFDRTYKLRAAGDQEKYEQVIRRKYLYLLKKTQVPSPAPLPITDHLPPLTASNVLSDWMCANWHLIPE